MSKVDFTTVAGIKAEIASIGVAGKSLDSRIQACAVASMKHMMEHRDHTLLVELYQALSGGMRRSALAAWMLQFTQLSANADPLTKKEKPFVLDKEKVVDFEGAVTTLWHTCGKPDPAPDELFDVNKAVMLLLKKVKAAKDAGRPVKGMDAETLAALQTLQ